MTTTVFLEKYAVVFERLHFSSEHVHNQLAYICAMLCGDLQKGGVGDISIPIMLKLLWESASLLTVLHTPLQFTYLSFSYLILSPKLFLSTKFPISSFQLFLTIKLLHHYLISIFNL